MSMYLSGSRPLVSTVSQHLGATIRRLLLQHVPWVAFMSTLQLRLANNRLSAEKQEKTGVQDPRLGSAAARRAKLWADT